MTLHQYNHYHKRDFISFTFHSNYLSDIIGRQIELDSKQQKKKQLINFEVLQVH